MPFLVPCDCFTPKCAPAGISYTLGRSLEALVIVTQHISDF